MTTKDCLSYSNKVNAHAMQVSGYFFYDNKRVVMTWSYKKITHTSF